MKRVTLTLRLTEEEYRLVLLRAAQEKRSLSNLAHALLTGISRQMTGFDVNLTSNDGTRTSSAVDLTSMSVKSSHTLSAEPGFDDSRRKEDLHGVGEEGETTKENPPSPPKGGASDKPTQTKRPRKTKQAHPWLLNLVAIYREHRVPIGVRWDTRGEAWLKTSEADTAKLSQVEQAIRRLLKATSKAEHRFIGLGAVLEGETWLPYLAAEPQPTEHAFTLPGLAPGQVPY